MLKNNTIAIPAEMLTSWQTTVDLIAKVAKVPASLIMKLHTHELEVFVANNNTNSPFAAGMKDSLGHGLYCESVIVQQTKLHVENALEDPKWCTNPALAVGMMSYYGLPLNWPDGEPFGTICMLDIKANSYSGDLMMLMECFRRCIEGNLEMLAQKEKLAQANLHLETSIAQRTFELEKLNSDLMQEIDSRIAAEKLLDIQQRFDSVTGLPKFNQLEKVFNKLIAKNELTSISIIHFSITNLKRIQDGFGYDISDKVRNTVVQKLQLFTNNSTYLAIFSETTFCIIIPTKKQQYANKMAVFCSRLCQQFSQDIYVDELSLSITTAMGVAFYPNDGSGFMDLSRKSSAALSNCEMGNNNSYKFFNPKMESELSSRIKMESLLRAALQRDELSLHYQPFVNTQSQSVVGAEVLIRWHNPILGQVSPVDFIEIAEHSGQIIEIGYFVLRSALKQLAYWREIYNQDFYLAINLSPVQLKDSYLVDKIVNLLELYKIPGHLLEIELTENALIHDAAYAQEVLSKLHRKGIRLSLDDFGTGYSSLSYLQYYPFNSIKIDRSFIHNLETSEQSRQLVNTIIAMANNLQLSLVAEGVENQFQADFVAKQGANIWQGYYLGKPVDANAFAQQYLIPSMTPLF
ncbi:MULTISPECIES: sensor domain-containing phosphodiesterase [Shewanella]|uniref:Phosphodiesterase n=1 Tax=Shewanella psychromarinicola TaxID=2487742 RepID=A0A3N4EWX6_9GAMM|nr:EAL domain-containing protein [Shewanella psychromarinicola]AZG34717.1 phosphodiesterase [Shewanella psychromarinicola]MCL1082226.1 EAL domain-containing protein [Shewanella psychromarinicola]RPA33494.1 phosphodiesterase [Shewanella psychromarinicola]